MKKKILFVAVGCLALAVSALSGLTLTPDHSLSELKSVAADECHSQPGASCFNAFQGITYFGAAPGGGFGG